jgi:hypothetical protein
MAAVPCDAMGEKKIEAYVQIPGLEGMEIFAAVTLLGKNLWETQLYAQENGLTVLSSEEINAVARAVKSETPTKEFLEYNRERTPYNDRYLSEIYKQLHNDLYHNYAVRAREILAWVESSVTIPRVVSSDRGSLHAYLIKDYEVVDNDRIKPTSSDSISQVNWPKEHGTITSELADLLEAPADTYVYTYPDTKYADGLRALRWGFRLRERPLLSSRVEPSDRDSYRGSLLGRKL